MAALLEKMPPDYTLATCPEKSPEDTIKVRPVVPQKPEDITSKMPADWRQQLLRHIEAKRLDRVSLSSVASVCWSTHTHTHRVVYLYSVLLDQWDLCFMCISFTLVVHQPDLQNTRYFIHIMCGTRSEAHENV